MNHFSNYLRLGYEHIVSYNALDHILFIIALMAVFQLKNWSRAVISITFFTIGHCLTLTLGAFDIVKVDKELIEFLIPVTILLTALNNITKTGQVQKGNIKYGIAGLFGLIHGLGFSNYYGILVMGETNYWKALLPFNLGVELGQLLIVTVILLILVIYEILLNKRHRDWNLFISGLAFGLALTMCIESWPY